MNFRRAERREPDKGSSQPLFLSLFLLLLAFFIMLNAMSTVEEGRSTKVLESVKRAFPSALRQDIADDLLDAEPGEVIDESVRAAIGTVFREVLPAVTVQAEPDGNPIFVSIPTQQVFSPVAGGVTPVMEQLAERLAPIVNRPPAGSVLDLQILYGTDPSTGRERRQELIFRASETVHVFVDREVEPAVLSAGLEPRDPAFVRLIFRTRPAGRSGPELAGVAR